MVAVVYASSLLRQLREARKHHGDLVIPVSCSLCAWESEAVNADEACRMGDEHLRVQHQLAGESNWLSNEELDTIEASLVGLTRGPWEWHDLQLSQATLEGPGLDQVLCIDLPDHCNQADLAFIAASRVIVPLLLREARLNRRRDA